MSKKIFTSENIERLRAMKAMGATTPIMALAIGAKSANSFRSRASQLGIFRKRPGDIIKSTTDVCDLAFQGHQPQ